MKLPFVIIFFLIALTTFSCKPKPSSTETMLSILAKVKKEIYKPENEFYPTGRLRYCDSILSLGLSESDKIVIKYYKAKALLRLGEEEMAIMILEELKSKINEDTESSKFIYADLALAYLRLGEQRNCVSNHASESCIVPIKGMGIHQNTTASEMAKTLYLDILKKDPNDLESRWLLNITYMTLGEYPQQVPAAFLLPGFEQDTAYKMNPFQDIAGDLKLDVNNMGGGTIADDFDNDGYLDIVTSSWDLEDPMHYFKNNADGTFTDLSIKSGLSLVTGGINIMQADYNNDGFLDILVLRGGWKADFGKEPNSLLKNNGNGTFTDVTIESGILSFHPTQTASWNDFNNDGWLDLFIGNETLQTGTHDKHLCELYVNNHDGTFTNMAKEAGCDILGYVKGVTSGDYDNDGWSDIFISTMDGKRILLKNKSSKQEIKFEDITDQAGLGHENGHTFPTWFWDYNNDGWLDIFVCDYTFDKPLAYFAAAEKLNIGNKDLDHMYLYRNNQDGTFTNVAKNIGLNKVAFAMGSNFGDIDNDGFLDIYLGTGNPDFRSLIPNKMFKNVDGNKFVDVTTSARVGHLQKGHGISFADMDNDGDQDIYVDMGGAYRGDSYQNSFFLNPGQGNNKWINISLVGNKSNWSAIGTRIKVVFRENGVIRNVYRDVNSGGSFGASPLRREIGLGSTDQIDELEIHWHGSSNVQVFKNIRPNQFLKITEGKNEIQVVPVKTLNWTLPDKLCLPVPVK